MQKKTRLRKNILPVSIQNEGVFLISEKNSRLLEGQNFIKIVQLLDGQYTEDEIADQLRDQLDPAITLYLLDQLQELGYITDQPTDLKPPLISISAHILEDINAALSFSILENSGLNISNNRDFSIVLTRDYLNPKLNKLNDQFIKQKHSWLLVKPVGEIVWLGPLFIPGKTGCWQCLEHRLSGHRKLQNYLRMKTQSDDLFTPPLSVANLSLTLEIAAKQIIQFFKTGKSPLQGKVITFDTQSLEQEEHILTRRPQCLRCGNPNLMKEQQNTPVLIQSQKKAERSPEETLEDLQHHISPITGLMKTPHKVSLGNKLWLYTASRNTIGTKSSYLEEELKTRTGGSSIMSVLGETIERISATSQGDEAIVTSTLSELGSAAIHPNHCMLFSEQQYVNREQTNSALSRFGFVPERFDENLKINWSPVWSLSNQIKKYLPTNYLYFGVFEGRNMVAMNSNGHAAGTCLEDAILRAFLEVVERHEVGIWWYNRLKRPAVDLSSFDHPFLREVETYYETEGRSFWVLDISIDFEIPTFAALSHKIDEESDDIIYAFGTHFDPQTAIVRAATELQQCLVAVNMKDQLNDPDANRWWSDATIANQPYLLHDKTKPLKTKLNYSDTFYLDLKDNIEYCLKLAQERGYEVFVHNQTRPDYGLSAVKVIIPGMRQMWRRLAPGSLYNVPVEKGFLKNKLREEDLNPLSIFI